MKNIFKSRTKWWVEQEREFLISWLLKTLVHKCRRFPAMKTLECKRPKLWPHEENNLHFLSRIQWPSRSVHVCDLTWLTLGTTISPQGLSPLPFPTKYCTFQAQPAWCFFRRVADLLSPEFLPSPTVCQSFSAPYFLSRPTFCLGAGCGRLASSSLDLCVFFSFHFLTYLLPTIIPSHALPSEQVRLSLHLADLSLHRLPACLPAFLCLCVWLSP